MSAMLVAMTSPPHTTSNRKFYALQAYPPYPRENLQDSNELALLQKLAQQGMTIAPMVVVDEAVETDFYRLNNLPEQLSQFFQGVNLQNPDEDDIEEIAPQAQALLKQSYLLDEVIDGFYEIVREVLPTADALTLRYPYPLTQDVHTKVVQGRPALMRLKHLWQARWAYDALWARVSQAHTIALPSYPILIHTPIVAEDAALSERSSKLLEQPVHVFHDATGAIVHLRCTNIS